MNSIDFQIKELSFDEIQNTNGGVFWIPLLLIGCTVIIEDWDNFKAGLLGKHEVPRD